MPGQIHAHGLGGDLIVPDGHEGAAVAGMEQQYDQADAYARDQEWNGGGKVERDFSFRVSDVEIVKGGEKAEHIGTVGDGPQFVPLEDGADDLRKAQRGNGQIIALEPQHRQADQEREGRRHQPGQNQRGNDGHGELDQAAVIVLVHHGPAFYRNGQNGVGVCPDEHKACLSQREQTREAVEQVHGNGYQRVGGALFQHGEKHGGGRDDLFQREDRRIDQKYDHAGHHRAQTGLGILHPGSFFGNGHLSHLTPYPSFFHRTDPWV